MLWVQGLCTIVCILYSYEYMFLLWILVFVTSMSFVYMCFVTSMSYCYEYAFLLRVRVSIPTMAHHTQVFWNYGWICLEFICKLNINIWNSWINLYGYCVLHIRKQFFSSVWISLYLPSYYVTFTCVIFTFDMCVIFTVEICVIFTVDMCHFYSWHMCHFYSDM